MHGGPPSLMEGAQKTGEVFILLEDTVGIRRRALSNFWADRRGKTHAQAKTIPGAKVQGDAVWLHVCRSEWEHH